MPLIEEENTNNRGAMFELEVLKTLVPALLNSDGIDEVMNPIPLRKRKPYSIYPQPSSLNPNPKPLNPNPSTPQP